MRLETRVGNALVESMTAARNETNPLLAGRTVVVIDPEMLAPAFASQLEAYGAQLIPCPQIEISDLESYEHLDDALDHLYGYDWLLFTSVSGVESFLRRLRFKELDASALDELRVCVAGDGAEKLLRDEHVHVDVAPGIPGTKPLFAALESFVGGLSGLSGLNFLSPRAVIARDWLARALNDAGARIDLVYAYRIQSSPGVDPGRTAAMFSAATDCIVLTSPASVVLLTRLFDSDDLGEVLAKVRIVCLDEATRKAAEKHGVNVKVLPAPATVAKLTEVIAEELRG